MKRARRRLLRALPGAVLAGGLGLAFCGALPARAAGPAETPLPQARHLPQHAAQAAKAGEPLILLVSLTGCKFCEKIRAEHLAPLGKAGVPSWQIHLDQEGKLVGFDGKPTTEKALARQLKVIVAPTVFFFDGQGRQLAEPLVGAMLDDFYAAYLEDARAAARAQLAGATK